MTPATFPRVTTCIISSRSASSSAWDDAGRVASGRSSSFLVAAGRPRSRQCRSLAMPFALELLDPAATLPVLPVRPCFIRLGQALLGGITPTRRAPLIHTVAATPNPLAASSLLVVVATASTRAAAVQARSRAGSTRALLGHDSSLSPQSAASNDGALSFELPGESSRATALSSNCCPYRAMSFPHCRPVDGFYPGDNPSDAGTSTTGPADQFGGGANVSAAASSTGPERARA